MDGAPVSYCRQGEIWMVAFAWERLKGTIVGQKYTLERLVSVSEDQAWFEGSPLGSFDRVAITCFPAEGYGPPEALSGLAHPHSRANLHVGREALEGLDLRYIVMEPVDELLSDSIAAHGPLSTSDARQLTRDLIAALEYLHRRNLVYCNLQPSTTYHFRFVAVTAGGTTEGPDETFTTKLAENRPFKGAGPIRTLPPGMRGPLS